MSAPTPAAAATTPAAAPVADASAASAAAPTAAGGANDMSKYGTHECTCDGCNTRPLMGFRYKCTKCSDHDICEACFAKFQKGVLPHVNKLNPVSKDVTAHAFQPYVDGKAFKSMDGAAKAQPKSAAGKVKPNDPCSCNSGKKAKKCCFDPSKK